MKKIILMLLFSGVIFPVYAQSKNLHAYPIDGSDKKLQVSSNIKTAPSCLIKISNDSHDDIMVYGTFDDGTILEPFMIYAYENPHYISLFYYNFCHAGMDIGINTLSGLNLYHDYTWVNSRLRIVSGWFKPYLVMEAKGPRV